MNNNVIISISFDDGNKSDLIALEEMGKYQWKGTSCIVTNLLENENMLTLDNVKYLYQNGWEIASHTVTHPHLPKLSDTDIDSQLKDSKNFFKQNNIDTITLSYPYGDYDKKVIDITKRYYSLGRIALTNFCYIDNKNFSPFDIKAVQISDIVNIVSLTKDILNLKGLYKSVWLNIFFHKITENISNSYYDISLKKFRNIIEMIHSQDIAVYTIKDGFETYMNAANSK